MTVHAKQTFPVKFTQAQRRVIADLLPSLADRLKLDEKNQRTIPFTFHEIDEIYQKAKAAVDTAQDGVTQNALRHVTDMTAAALDKFQGIRAIPITERLYQFKITLRGVEPPIWRR